MKKLLLATIAGLFVFASCTKDRTCECTVNGVTEKGTTYIGVTKSFMKNTVGCVSTERTEGNTTYKEECVIK